MFENMNIEKGLRFFVANYFEWKIQSENRQVFKFTGCEHFHKRQNLAIDQI